MQLIERIASTGLAGVFLALAVYAYWSKDKELKAEMQQRIADAQQFNTLALNLQKELIRAVNRLGEIVEWVEGQRRRRKEEDEP